MGGVAKGRKRSSSGDISQEIVERKDSDEVLQLQLLNLKEQLSQFLVDITNRKEYDEELQSQILQSKERITALEAAESSEDPVITCSMDVQANMLVYIDSSGIARPAKANSNTTMPARFFVTGKPTTTSCSVTKATLKLIPNDTAAGKVLYVSETVAGGVQITVPTTPGSVLQPVGEGLAGNKRFYSISDRATVRS